MLFLWLMSFRVFVPIKWIKSHFCHRAAAGVTSKPSCRSSSGLVSLRSQLRGQCGGETVCGVFFLTQAAFICLFPPVCNEPHCCRLSFQSWFIAPSPFSFIFPTVRFHHSLLQAPSPRVLRCLSWKPGNAIFYYYRSNIYTTLGKLHLAGNTFRCVSSPPHGVAGGLAPFQRQHCQDWSVEYGGGG